MEKDWVKKLSAEQLSQMLAELQTEIDFRRYAQRAEAWETLKTALREYLKFGPVEIGLMENNVYLDNDSNIDMDSVGYIGVDEHTW